MLDPFKRLIDSLSAFDFGAEMRNVVDENINELTPAVQDQLSKGFDGNDNQNTVFGKQEYSQKTISIKEAKGVGLGRETGYVTNYMSGDFYRSLVFKTDGDVFEADSDVPYFGDIRLYSDPALLEVDEANRKEFAEAYTLPGVAAALKQKTGLVINA